MQLLVIHEDLLGILHLIQMANPVFEAKHFKRYLETSEDDNEGHGLLNNRRTKHFFDSSPYH